MQRVESRLTIIFTAFLFSSLVYLIVGFALTKSEWKPLMEDGNLPQTLFVIFVLLSVSLMGVLLKLKKSRLVDSEKNAISTYILLFALAEVPSILGLVVFLLTGKFLFLLLLCFISLISFLLVKPSAEA